MPSLFEDEFQAFVEDGGLDQVDGIVSEDYERARMKTLCLHGKPRKDCTYCYVPPTPYWPSE